MIDARYSHQIRQRQPVLMLLAVALLASLVLGACGVLSSDGNNSFDSGEESPAPGLDRNGIEDAPDFELALFETPNHSRGEQFRLSDLEGRPVVINFWFPSCPPCVAEMPDFEKAFQEYGDRVAFVGVQMIGIDTAEEGQEFVNRLGVTFALGADPTNNVVREYKVSGFPTTVFVDKDQKIVRKWTGPLDLEKLKEIILEELLG